MCFNGFQLTGLDVYIELPGLWSYDHINMSAEALDGAIIHILHSPGTASVHHGWYNPAPGALQKELTDTFSFSIYLFLKMSQDLGFEFEMCQAWRGPSFSNFHVSCREFMQLCSMPSTLYGDPTSLKLCHREIKSCNDFQYIDMDNNCIG